MGATVIRFERTKDWEMIRKVLTDPKIYPAISDDGSPAVDEFRPIQNDGLWYVAVWDDVLRGTKELCGIFLFAPLNAATWEIHTCLLPHTWGAKAAEIAKALHQWGWEHMPCQRIITNVPAYNRLALRFAKCAGMREFGVNPASYLKNGKLYDQIMLGISREAN